jgi:hypothetical protein
VDHDAVLFANEAFYQAFAARDLAAMEEVWARCRCLHPSAGCRCMGGAAVMRSWQGILAGTPAVACHDARATIFGDSAMVVCFEACPAAGRHQPVRAVGAL